MMRWTTIILMLAGSLLPIGASADEPLPRVLIIGDSMYHQPARTVTQELKDRAQVVYVTAESGEVCNSTYVLEHLEALLGDQPWDVIHFNVGLGDLVYRAPGMESFRVMPIHAGGVRATSPQQYEENLRALVGLLKQTDAKLVWASTTPIRASGPNLFELGSEIEYNRIAARVMQEQGVPINDMYTYMFELIDMDKPAGHNADPFDTDKKPIHEPIVASVLRALGLAGDGVSLREAGVDMPAEHDDNKGRTFRLIVV